MRFIKSAAILSGLVLAGQAGAAEIFLSATPLTAATAPVAAGTATPLIPAVAGQDVPVYIYAQLLPLTPNTNPGKVPTERLNGLGMDLTESTDIAHGTSFLLTDQDPATASDGRWDVPASQSAGPISSSNETVGHGTLASFRRGAVSTIGLTNAGKGGDSDPTDIVGTDGNFYLQVGVVTVHMDSNGSTPLFLATNANAIAYSTGQTTVNFGPNDPVTITNDPGGRKSLVADATLGTAGTVPEPASLGMLGLAGLLVARRRKA